jgi:Icc protein
MPPSSRRDLLAGMAALPALGTISRAASGEKMVLEIAHVTDIHITRERQAPQGVAQMFRHMLRHSDWNPALVLNTGDSIMKLDAKENTGKIANEEIRLWKETVKDLKVPMKSCLGNHDMWNGLEPVDASQAALKPAGFMVQALDMPAPYYSFDQAGWHFIALNSVATWPSMGELGQAQLDWLKNDLANTPKSTPVLVFSHFPILSVTSSVYGDTCRKGRDLVVPGNWQHLDCWEISELFRQHGKVKLCLSGHMHTQDECRYRGTTYICGGAACGAWWEGSEYGFPPCYGKIRLFADGGFEYSFIDYQWTGRAWKGKQFAQP